MGKYVSFVVMLLLVGGAGTSYSQANNPKDAYREIYNLISKAEESTNTGNRADAAAKYQEIIVRLKNFQQQYPDWEVDIVRYRLNYAETQLQALRVASPPQPNYEQPAPQPVPQPQPIAPTYSSFTQNPPAPAPTYTPPAPAPAPAPTYTPPAPNPNPTYAPPRTYPPAPDYGNPAPSNNGAPIVRMPSNSETGTPTNYGPAPTPQSQVTDVRSSNPRTGGLQTLARQVESELNRLMDENQELRSALSEAQSRVEVANNYMKVLTRENELLQKRLDDEVRRREELQHVLTDDLAQFNNHWNVLREKVRGLMEAAPVDPNTVPAGTLPPLPAAPMTGPSTETTPPGR